jgi:hypothetical protein
MLARRADLRPGELLRFLRAIEVLERFRTAEAREALEAVAAGARVDWLTQQPRASLARWPRP